jgi:hypothetical protein
MASGWLWSLVTIGGPIHLASGTGDATRQRDTLDRDVSR